ncbi:hypothetical protein [Nocardioides speluncae]|uniref:hypothetical protein n=1 Tax=Nocardioides speluncae TaxID=2670337 RepID=UPI0012B16178|nr:hypothetical protein [Nocardioides speluncae]
MNPLVRRALGAGCAAIVTLGLTAGVAPSAYAEKLVRDDARRDVVRAIESDAGETLQPAPRAADPDILRVAVDHRTTALLIRTKYAALDRRVVRTDALEIRTSAGKRFEALTFVHKRGQWQGRTAIGTGSAGVDCPGLRHRFDYEANVATWTIPRSCIGRPRWVRVGVGTGRGTWDGPFFIDDAFRKGIASYNENLVLSRRIWKD